MSKALILEIPGDVADALRLPNLEKAQRLRLEPFCVLVFARHPRVEQNRTASGSFALGDEPLTRRTQSADALRLGELAEDLQHSRVD